ncbi:Imm45 family immunity protein [Pseudomonas abietaniphila]|uniref:Imm45 family immunity protein n=1 Tax=Pseudomonas abietaniphila TaxID=89065 RepID=UPI0009421FD8|nr:Imm45 family immunity protein [Pseudomonas abietaniphila]
MDVRRKLVDIKSEVVERGNVLTVSGSKSYEGKVDFMVFETGMSDRPYGLIVSSGYKAGLILAYLPPSSARTRGGIDRKWLIEEWSKWVCPESDVRDVWWRPYYEAD